MGLPRWGGRGRLAAGFAAAAVLIALWAAGSWAAGSKGPGTAPSNDTFASAQAVAGNAGSASGSNVGATGESGEPLNFGHGPIHSVWYSWVAPNDGTVTIDLCVSATFDTTLAVYTGAAVNALTRVAGNDDYCALKSRLTYAATAGSTYQISVDGYDGETGSFVLSWNLPSPPPANDNFLAAAAISGNDGSVAGTTVGATTETSEPINAGPGPVHSVWYAWTVPNAGTVTIDTCTPPASGAYDTTLGVYTGTSAQTLTPIAVDDDSCGSPQAQVSFSAVAGTLYDISIDGYSGQTGNFVLAWALQPANDQFAGATTVSGFSGSSSGGTIAATGETGEPANQGSTVPLASVWYSWTAPFDGTVTVDTCTLPPSQAYDTTLGVYQGTSVDALTLVGTNDDTCGSQSRVSFAATNGLIYRISVDGHAGARGHFVLTWNLPVAALSVGDAAITEGNGGTVNESFAVTLSLSSSQIVTVNWATADGTATAPSDYTAGSGSLTFNPGETSKSVAVTVNGDTTYETDETFFVNLSGASGAPIADGQGVGTITNDDALPAISVGDVTHAEGNSGTTLYLFAVSMTNPSSSAVTVDYATADGTAIAPIDYTAASGTVTFTAGQVSQTVTVSVNGDTTYEPDEGFLLNLSNVSGGTISDSQGVGGISNDDPVPTISVNDVSKLEGNSGTTGFDFTVSLSNPSYQLVSVNYGTQNGTAVAPFDYTSTPGTLPFGPGTTSATVTVPVVGETVYESDETFTFNLNAPVGGTISDGVGLGTILNDDPVPAFSVNDRSKTEGNSGQSTLTFTVTLSNPSPNTVSVNWATADGTATAPADYISGSGTLSFPAGTLSKSFGVAVVGDTVDEADETFLVNLSGASSGSTISDGQGVGTIQDDDPSPTLAIGDASVTEGNSGPVSAVFTVTLAGSTAQTVTVGYATADGTAAAPGDYTATSGTLTYTPGQTTKTVTVQVQGDTLDEPDETYTVLLSNPVNATLADGSGLGTILDDDPQPALSIADTSVTEGNSGTATVSFTVTLSAASGQTVSVAYATADGTAVAPADYTAAGGTLTVVAGQGSGTVSVTVNGDTTDEDDETFTVTLSNAVNASIARATATGTILDDDPAPTLAVGDQTVTEGNAGTTSATFTVTLTGSTQRTATVDWATADGTATAPSDYTAASGTLTFAPGDSTETLTVLVNGDTSVEPDETFFVNLSNASNATLADGQGQGTILNDDLGADLAVTTTDSPDPVQVGSNLTYVVKVQDLGALGATGVTLTETVPPGPTVVSITPSQGSCSGTGTVTCSLGSVASGGQATVTVVVRPTSVGSGTITNTASATGNEPDPNGSNNSSSESTTVVPNAAGCTIVGGGGADTLTGTSGDDVICGGGGNDTIRGNGGNDTLRGEAGNDTLFGGLGNDTFDGGIGNDTVSFAETGVTSGSTVDLTGVAAVCGGIPCADNAQLGHDTFVVDGTSGLSTVENLTGTGFADTLTGDGGANRLTGGSGNDILNGGGGNDQLSGGAGNDTVNGQDGSDTVKGDAGNDTLSGGAGNDTFDGGTNLDTVTYFGDPAGITANLGTGAVTDGYGNSDTLTGVEILQGSDAGADQLTGSTANNTMNGNGGDDTLLGLAGNDTLDGGAGNDTLDGGPGTDTCTNGETVSNCEARHARTGPAPSGTGQPADAVPERRRGARGVRP